MLKRSILGQQVHQKPQYYVTSASFEYAADSFAFSSWWVHHGSKIVGVIKTENTRKKQRYPITEMSIASTLW